MFGSVRLSCGCEVRLLNHIMPNEFIWLHCIQLYLLDLLYLSPNFALMNNTACTSCNVTGNQLMEAGPECGAAFVEPCVERKVRAALGLLDLVAIAAVFFL